MSHYPGVTALVGFSFVYCFCLFVCLLVDICIVCLCVLLFLSYLSVCVHNLVLYLRFVYGPMAKIQ